MTDPPPPTGPPAGWYPDPSTGYGLRWWDGTSWTDQTSLPPPADDGAGLTAAGEWLRESLRIAASRAGHFLPMVVVLLIPTSLLNGLFLWFALREAVLITDPDAGTFTFVNPSGGAGPYALVLITGTLVALATLFLSVAVARQAEAELEDRPEPWSVSMVAAGRRSPRIIGVGLAVVAIIAGLYLVMVLSAVVPVLLLVTIPLWIVGSVLAAVRLVLAPVAAALAPAGTSALRTSWDLTRSRFWALLGRMVLLVVISFMFSLLTSVMAAPFTAAVGGGGNGSAPVDNEVRLGDLMGDNPAVFAIGQLFSALGQGAAAVLWSIGLVLIYRRLNGPSVALATDEGATSDGVVPGSARPDGAASDPDAPGHGF